MLYKDRLYGGLVKKEESVIVTFLFLSELIKMDVLEAVHRTNCNLMFW